VTAAFIAGFVVGEGSFIQSGRRFRFAVQLGAIDSSSCEALRTFFNVGRVYWSPRRKPHHDDVSTYTVQALPELLNVIVPFMDEHLPASFKREQYSEWRGALVDYWENRAKRRRPCTVEGCDIPQRGRGLCRRHYFLAGFG
jgi:hypothetical protein